MPQYTCAAATYNRRHRVSTKPGLVSESAVRLEGVRKAFDGHTAVKDLTLAIPRGSIFGLLGPNGAGKTTTLRMVLDVLGPDTGTIEVLGLPAGRAVRDRIGYMPEERGLYPRMVVREQLLFMAEIKGVTRALAQARLPHWLERLGLAAWGGRKLNELSKGMQQKAQFIATVLHEPEVLILDEPLSGLDPVGTDLMRDVLLELRRAGTTLVLSSHQMDTVERLCDRVALIHRGEKVLDGSVTEVKRAHGQNTLALAYEGDASFLTSLPGVARVRDSGRFADVHLRPGSDPQAILREVAVRLRVSRFEIVEPSLHDIFVSTVKEKGPEAVLA
jgi:ABC-2 type transport system ATP-binding protein